MNRKNIFAILCAILVIAGCDSDTESTNSKSSSSVESPAQPPLSADAKTVIDLKNRMATNESVYSAAEADFFGMMVRVIQAGESMSEEQKNAENETAKKAMSNMRIAIKTMKQVNAPTLSDKEAEKSMGAAVAAHLKWADLAERKMDKFANADFDGAIKLRNEADQVAEDEAASLLTTYQILKILDSPALTNPQ